jgi:hypothetical protein
MSTGAAGIPEWFRRRRKKALSSGIFRAFKVPFHPLKALGTLAELSRFGLVMPANTQVLADTPADFLSCSKANKVNFTPYHA